MPEVIDQNELSKQLRNDAEFERILKEYKKVIQQLKKKAIAKYGAAVADLFGM